MTYIIISLLVYVIVMAYFGYMGFKRTKNSSDYLLAGKQMNPIVMALSYGATFISTSAIVGFGGAAGQYGLGLIWLTALNILVGVFIAFVVFGKKTREVGHKLGTRTMPELFARRFNCGFMQGYSGILIFVFMPVYASAVLKGIVDYVSKYTGVSFGIILIVVSVLTAVFVVSGGLKGIMYSDAFQGSLMFAGMAFLIIYTYSMLGGVTRANEALAQLPSMPGVAEQTAGLVKGGFSGWTSMPTAGSPVWWNIVTTLVAGVGIGALAQPQLSVKFMTVKSSRDLNRAVLSGGIFILFMTGVAFTVGALSNVAFYNATGKIAINAAGSNDGIIPVFIREFFPDWFGGVFLIILIAAAISTLSALVHTMGTALGRDFHLAVEQAGRQHGDNRHRHLHVLRPLRGHLPADLFRGALHQKLFQKGRSFQHDYRLCGQPVLAAVRAGKDGGQPADMQITVQYKLNRERHRPAYAFDGGRHRRSPAAVDYCSGCREPDIRQGEIRSGRRAESGRLISGINAEAKR